jgi:hypothetical protein
MTKGDQLVESTAERVRSWAEKAAETDGVASKLAEPLAEDAAFLRKLKPSLMIARARGEAPTDQKPGAEPVAPPAPQLGRRPKPKKASGPNPFLVAAAALAAGIVLAKLIDWRSHAHPRD